MKKILMSLFVMLALVSVAGATNIMQMGDSLAPKTSFSPAVGLVSVYVYATTDNALFDTINVGVGYDPSALTFLQASWVGSVSSVISNGTSFMDFGPGLAPDPKSLVMGSSLNLAGKFPIIPANTPIVKLDFDWNGHQTSVDLEPNTGNLQGLGTFFANGSTNTDMTQVSSITLLVPEPITMVLLSLGGLFLRRRMA